MRRSLALLALFAALAVLHTWPLASDIAGLSRLDNDDTGLNVWIIAWVAHIVFRHPLQLFDAPMFHPEPHTLAYSEHMLLPGLMGAPLLWAGASAVTAYNLLAIAGFALSGWTMSLVMDRWTGRPAAGIAAGMLFAFNAHLLTRLPHLQALHVEFFPLALWAFDRAITGGEGTGVQGTGVQSAEVQTTEVQTTEVQTTEVQTTEVQTTEVQTTGVQTTGVQGTGAHDPAGRAGDSAWPAARSSSAAHAASAAPSVSAASAVQSTGVRTTEVQTTEVQTTEVQTTGVQTTGVQGTGAHDPAGRAGDSAWPAARSSSAAQAASATSAAPSVSAASAAPSVSASSAALTLASVFVLQALCSNYSLVFLSAALLVAAGVRLPEWLGPGHRARLTALAGAGALAVVGVSPFLWPYYQVSQEQGLVRSIDEVRLYSAGWLDYLATGGRLHYDWWSYRFFEGRTALFPGVAGLGLAALGVASRPILRDRRVRMIAAIGVAGFALSFGPALPGYEWLQAHVPLLQGIRAAARWGFLFLMAIAMLAGFGVAALERRWRGSVYWPAILIAVLGLVTIEALRVPMGFVATGPVPAIYVELAEEPEAVLVELPLYSGASVSENARYLVAATVHFRPLVNGYSGFETEAFRNRAARWRAFPSDAVLDEMRALGVTHVMVHIRDLGPEQVDQAAHEPRLALERDDGERRLYRLIR